MDDPLSILAFGILELKKFTAMDNGEFIIGSSWVRFSSIRQKL